MMVDDYSIVGDNRSKSNILFNQDINDKSNLGNGHKPRQ